MLARIYNKGRIAVATLFALALCLYSDSVLAKFDNSVGSVLRSAAAILRNSELQWSIFLCGTVYFAFFMLLRSRQSVLVSLGARPPALWLLGLLILETFAYAFNYSSSAASTQALTLLAGAILGIGVNLWMGSEGRINREEGQTVLELLVVFMLVVLLEVASVWNLDSGRIFEYRGHTRWTGPWDNPNIFGLLMGTGVVLAFGITSGIPHFECDKSRKSLFVLLSLLAALFMAHALSHSYSRGAWLGTLCGGTYLIWQRIGSQSHIKGYSHLLGVSRLQKALLFSIVLVSAFTLVFWHYRHTEWQAARRAFSIGNVNDFSLQNRMSAWEGAMQMTADRPWVGFGWNTPEDMYNAYYRASKINETAAIQLNDYCTLSATLGVPALFCFGLFVWLSLSGKSEIRNQNQETQAADWINHVCRAGAIVLLAGFWFDGGLFKLPTATTFWILLELGRDG